MTRAQIKEHNRKVAYNATTVSWISDIIACIIFFPYLVFVIYRRGKYRDEIDISQAIENFTK